MRNGRKQSLVGLVLWGAGMVALGLHVLGFTATSFAFTNCALIVLWVFVSIAIAREHKKLLPEAPKPGSLSR